LLHMFTFLFCYTYSHIYSVTHSHFYSATHIHIFILSHIHIFILLHIFTFLFCHTYSHFYCYTYSHFYPPTLFWYTCPLSLHPSINYHSYSLCKPYHPIKAFLQFFSLFLVKKSILIIVFPGERKKINCSQVVTFV
jgi:hypothetical protein